MAEEIGSLVARVGLDGTNFQQGIASINRQLKIVQSEFQAASAKLEGFGDSADELRLRADSLSKQVDLQRQKVEALRLAHAKAAEEKGHDAKETQNLQIRLNKSLATLAKMENELRSVNEQIEQQSSKWSKLSQTLERTSESLRNTGERLSGVGQSLSASLSIPLAAAGTAALKFASDIDSATSDIQIKMGATAQEAEKLAGLAKEVWQEGWGDSIGSVAEDIAILRRNLGEMGDEMTGELTQAALLIEQKFGASVEETTKTVRTMLRNFEGLSETQAFDLIITGFQKGGDFAQDLLDTLNEYSPQFAAIGYSAQEMLNILIAGAEAGAFNLDKVGDAVKEFNIRMKDGSDTTSEALTALGLNAQQMSQAFAEGGEKGKQAFAAVLAALAAVEDPLKRNQLGVALFGTMWEDLEANVITAMTNSKNALGDFEGATQRAIEAAEQSFGMRLSKVWRDLQDALEPLGQILLDIAEQWLPKISSAIESLSNWFNSLSPATQQLLVLFGSLAAIVGPVAIVMGNLVSIIGSAFAAFSTLASSLVGVSGAFAALSSPIGVAVATIGGLIAIGVLLVKNWDEIKKKLQEVWQKMAPAIQPAVNAVATFITQKFQQLQTWWNQLWLQMKEAFANIWNAIKAVVEPIVNAIVKLMQWAWPLIKTLIVETWENVKGVIDGALKVIMGLLKSFASLFTGDWKGLWEGVKQIFSGTVELIWNAFQLWGTGKILKFVGFLSGQLGRIFRSIWSEAYSIFSAGLNRVFSIVSNIFNRIISFVRNLGSSFYNAGKGLIDQMKRGIERAADAVIDSVRRLASKVRDFLPFSPAKEGPLSDLDKLDFGGPIAKSIESAMPRIQGMLHEMLSLPTMNINANVASAKSPAPAASGIVGGNIIIQQMVVRNDSDILRIARELHRLQQTRGRAQGVVR